MDWLEEDLRIWSDPNTERATQNVIADWPTWFTHFRCYTRGVQTAVMVVIFMGGVD